MANFALILTVIFSVVFGLCDAVCEQLFVNKVSSADQTVIVNKHNYLRSLISQGKINGQPRGKNLKTISWDPQLANEAQKIANSCNYGHAAVKDSRFYVGQNIAQSSSSGKLAGADWNGIIEMWFNENKNFVYPNKSRKGGVTGHYTQVVWADTYRIGCGYTYYHKNGQYENFYVCNYGPGGNIIGKAPYQV